MYQPKFFLHRYDQKKKKKKLTLYLLISTAVNDRNIRTPKLDRAGDPRIDRVRTNKRHTHGKT